MATAPDRSDSLTSQQAAVFAAVSHYHEALGEPCPGSYVARKLRIAKQVVQRHLEALHRKGWLRGPSAPAIPARSLPRHARGVTKSHLPGGGTGCDLPDVAKRTVQTRKPGESVTVDMPPLSLRADVVPQSVDDEARTAELVFTTGAPVQRYDWWNDERYIETLSLEPEHVRIDRLNTVGPLLNAHSAYDVSDQIGAVVPGSVKLTKKEGRCTVRFSKRAEVAPIWQDLKDGILRSVSVGYKAYVYEETAPGKDNAMPIRKAIDWEPYEVSMVPIPADAGARVRGEKRNDTNPCQIVTVIVRSETTPAKVPPKKETHMEDAARSETIAETDPLTPPATRTAEPPAPTERDSGVTAERERVQGIRNACLAARLPRSFEDALIERGTPLVKAQGEVLDELRKRGGDDRGPRPGPQEVRVGDDPLVHVRAGMENALLHRFGQGMFKLEEIGRKYRGMGVLDVARVFLSARGIRTTDLSKMELAGAALGLDTRGGMHTTSDFAILLADVAKKTLREAYAEAPQTFAPITRRVTLSDFKPSNRVQIGDAPALLEVKEHGEFKRGTITESKEVLQLKTFGRVFAITRQALVNDDIDAFSRVVTMFGRSARTLESDKVWEQITSNPVMGDGVALFHASHGNLDAVPSVISVASLGKARAAMRVQKGIDGTTVLNVNPRYLGLPAALETTAATFLTQITPATPANVNPFAGVLSPIVEPRLDANSVTAWYLFAGDGFDVIELATLEGEAGPMVESRIGFDIDGLEIKARHDVAAKVIDWRGVWKNPGA